MPKKNIIGYRSIGVQVVLSKEHKWGKKEQHRYQKISANINIQDILKCPHIQNIQPRIPNPTLTAPPTPKLSTPNNVLNPKIPHIPHPPKTPSNQTPSNQTTIPLLSKTAKFTKIDHMPNNIKTNINKQINMNKYLFLMMMRRYDMIRDKMMMIVLDFIFFVMMLLW